MALIHCPECGKEVSNKAVACIHCGYPLADSASKGFQVVLASIGQNKVAVIKELRELRPEFGLVEAMNVIESVPCVILQGVPQDRAEYAKRCFQTVGAHALTQPAGSSISRLESMSFTESNSSPICPKCKSTSITTGQRGFSWFSGFIGSRKTINRCGNCGYSWQPKAGR